MSLNEGPTGHVERIPVATEGYDEPIPAGAWDRRRALVQKHYADYLDAMERLAASNPAHCDNLVLHAPADCKYCDHQPELQAFRLSSGIDFTGGTQHVHLYNWRPCPSQVMRSLEKSQAWGGNVAMTAEMEAARDAALAAANRKVAEQLVRDRKHLIPGAAREFVEDHAPDLLA